MTKINSSAIFDLIREFYRHRRGYILFSLSLLVTMVVVGILLEYFIDLTHMLRDDQLESFDQQVTSWVFQYRGHYLTLFFTAVTTLGNAWSYFIVVPATALFLYYRGHKWHLSILATIILLSTSLLNILIKHIIARPRPLEKIRLVQAFSFSYPSGHSMSAMSFYGFLIYLTLRFAKPLWLKILLSLLLLGLIFSIGMSRIYLGVHFPSDVLAGFIAGIIWLMLFIIAFNTSRFLRRKSEINQPLEK